MPLPNLQSNRANNSYWRALILLAIPTIIENVLQSMVGFVDSLFISKLGLAEVAAVGIANAILQIYFAVFLAIGTASTVFVARHMGAKQMDKVRQVVSQSIILTFTVGLLFGIISLFFSERLLSVMGANQEVLEVGTAYFRIVATPSILISMMYTAGAILRGTGDTITPMRVGIGMNFVHIILDYVLIFGVFFQGLGIKGAAIATVLARLFGVFLLLYQLYKKRYLSFDLEVWKVKKEAITGIIKLGIPSAFERLFMRIGQIIYFGMIIRMGTEVYAAHTLAGNFTIFSSVVGTGLATATTTLVGQSLGAKDMETAKKYSYSSVIVTSIIMTMGMFIISLTSPLTTHIFTTNQMVVELIVIALWIDTIAQPATAAVNSLTAVLQAGGDTKFPMYVTAFGIWALRTVGVYVLGVHFGFGLVGVWVSIAIDNYVRAGILYIRFRSNGWIKNLS